MEVISTAD